MPDAFRQLQASLLKRPGGCREMVEIPALVLQHDEQEVYCHILETGNDSLSLSGSSAAAPKSRKAIPPA